MMPTLYRMETNPELQQQMMQQQGAQQQASGSLPMQRPAAPQEPQPQQQGGNGNFAQTYQQGKPETAPLQDDIKAKFMGEIDAKAHAFGENRMTAIMQNRVADFAENLRVQMESGNMTKEEAKQVLSRAIQGEYENIQGWMDGKPEPTNWRETKNPEATKKFLLQNKQAFEEAEKVRKEVTETKAKLEAVEDKKNPKYQKAMGLLEAKRQKLQQMEETLRQGLYGGEMVESGLQLKKARGESTDAQ